MSLVGILIVCVSGSTVISGGRFVHGTDLIEFVCLSPDLKPTVCFGINHHDSRGTKSNNTRETWNQEPQTRVESRITARVEPRSTIHTGPRVTTHVEPRSTTRHIYCTVCSTHHHSQETIDNKDQLGSVNTPTYTTRSSSHKKHNKDQLSSVNTRVLTVLVVTRQNIYFFVEFLIIKLCFYYKIINFIVM